MPLLGIFSKKANSRSKVSTTASNAGHSASNISLDDEDYVSVTSPNSEQHGSSSNPQYRRSPGQAQLHPHSQLPYLDPLLEPPPRRSSLFQNFQDDPTVHRSTQSLPDSGDRRGLRPKPHPQQVLQDAPSPAISQNVTTKRSMFSWKSNKDRSKSTPSVKPSEDSSFNLKSFRHVRPDSPSSLRTSSAAPSLPPIPTPTPISAIPSPPISFQVTSRRPRGNSITDPTSSPSQQVTTSQQKMAAGAFRQAARRSSTSLTLTESPVLSPVSPTRSSLDDRPPPSLLPPTLARPSTPSRSPASAAPTASPRPSTPTRPPRQQPPPTAPARAPPPTSTPRIRTNAFAASSSSSSSEEDEDEDDDSTDDGTGLTRKTTIKPRAGTLPPLSATVREQIQRATPPADSAPPRAQSSLGVYGAGSRQRASMSVGALTPSAKEARASIAIAANARLMNAPRPPFKATQAAAQTPASRRAPGSDTSESAADSDSDEDAPLSSLVPPRRPGTAMSSHSAPGGSRKPLVDLETPSTLTGRPIGAPPPISREDKVRSTRTSVDFSPRTSSQDSRSSKMSPASSPRSPRISQAPSNSRLSLASQGSRASQPLIQQGPKPSPIPQSSRASQISSHHPSRPSPGRSLINLDTSATSQSTMSRSNLSPPSVVPPMRPFARRESPASSTGDSSSGKAPLTPRDGSDLGVGARSAYSGASRGRPGHGRKPSVTFEDEQEPGAKGKQRERDGVNPQEARLRERRRTEARAAIELGNVVNGPPPVDDDDVTLGQHSGMQMGWGQQGMQIPMPPVPPMYNMGMNMSMPSPGPFGFGTPPPGGDAAYLAAHQQAMLIAKQTFQYAVAQQALAAANEEWERNSTAGPQWGGSQWGGSAYGMGMGMGMGMRSSTLFPPAPRSMYAGSVGGAGGAGWGGGGSVYGESFGPARQSIYSQADLSTAANAQQRPARPRTKTAPSASTPPAGLGRMPAPPSSFRGVGH